MQNTLELRLTLNADTLSRALSVINEAGFSPEAFMIQVLERCAQEGEIPLKRSRAKKRSAAYMAGVFSQGSLFSDDDESAPEAVQHAARSLQPVATLETLTALQESQAMLRWRARERKTLTEADANTPLAATLGANQALPLTLLETKQFRLDKRSLIEDPARRAVIRALEQIFRTLTARAEPEGALPLAGSEETGELVVPVIAPGLTEPRVLIVQKTPSEVCCVRYGDPRQLLKVTPLSLLGDAAITSPDALRAPTAPAVPSQDNTPSAQDTNDGPIVFDNLPTIPPLESLFS